MIKMTHQEKPADNSVIATTLAVLSKLKRVLIHSTSQTHHLGLGTRPVNCAVSKNNFKMAYFSALTCAVSQRVRCQ